MPVLDGDIAAPDDNQALGQLFQLQRRLVGEIVDPLQPLHRRHERPRAGGDKYLFALQLLAADLQGVVGHEAGLSLVESKVFHALHPLAQVLLALAAGESHPLHDGPEIDRLHGSGDAEPARLLDFHDSIRRVDELLGGDTAPVEAGAPDERAFIDEGRFQAGPGGLVRDKRPAAGADNDNFVVFHPLYLPAG